MSFLVHLYYYSFLQSCQFEMHILTYIVFPYSSRQGKFKGYRVRTITLKEMYHFLGICLKMSIDNQATGGYASYFEEKLSIAAAHNVNIEVTGRVGWAAHYMSINRYKYIRSAFHPEIGTSVVKDKCHQLRAAIKQLNRAAKTSFKPGPRMSFDEGGVPMRSRFCPVRMYNKDKPDKYRVDFFVLADAEAYFIYHLDVYQGKNDAEVEIHNDAKGLPTTQKAVINAICSSGLSNDPEGYRELFADNRYMCPELAVLLKNVHMWLSSGTVRSNRKGWEKDLLGVFKANERGTYKMAYDETNEVLIIEWKDSKVVNVCSTLGVHSDEPITRQVGATKKIFPCPVAIVKYQKGMGGVDRGDQCRLMGAGFAKKAHYKKWYKKSFFAILDFMLLNGYIAWNMAAAAENGDNKYDLPKWEFYAFVAEQLLGFDDDDDDNDDDDSDGDDVEDVTPASEFPTSINCLHEPVPIGYQGTFRGRCRICNLENRDKIGGAQSKTSLAQCKSCGVVAHLNVPENSKNMKVFGFPEFTGLSCMEIAHHHYCNGLWGASSKTQSYTVKTSHPLYTRIKRACEVDPRRQHATSPPE